MIKKILGLLALVLIAGALLAFGFVKGLGMVYNSPPTYETVPPALPHLIAEHKVLVFSKTNGFRHIEAIPAAKVLFSRLAQENGWGIAFTQNAAVHNATQLAQFDLVVWNNVTGDVLTNDQRAAFRTYVENGGTVLALHGSGGSRSYAWDWRPQELIKTQFVGHPMSPQFREATVLVEDTPHPSTKHLPKSFKHVEEWYSFANNPRDRVTVLATVREADYGPQNRTLLETLTGAGELAMGDDHPIIWHHKVGAGTVYFTALGHMGEAYALPDYQILLEEAARWLITQRVR